MNPQRHSSFLSLLSPSQKAAFSTVHSRLLLDPTYLETSAEQFHAERNQRIRIRLDGETSPNSAVDK